MRAYLPASISNRWKQVCSCPITLCNTCDRCMGSFDESALYISKMCPMVGHFLTKRCGANPCSSVIQVDNISLDYLFFWALVIFRWGHTLYRLASCFDDRRAKLEHLHLGRSENRWIPVTDRNIALVIIGQPWQPCLCRSIWRVWKQCNIISI